MPTAIPMPDFGTAVDEIKVVRWLVAEGAEVSRGTILVELETDKAVTELESVAAGTVLKLCAAEGSMVKAGEIIAYVGSAGESLAPPAPKIEGGNGGQHEAPLPISASAGESPAPPKPPVATMVANLAAKLGVDLSRVEGTGEGGRITREDVLRAKAVPAAAPAVEEVSRAQAAVARAVSRSHTEIPQLTVTASVDMSAAERLRTQPPHAGRKAFYDAVFLKAMALALDAAPLIGARLEGNRIVRPSGIHIAFAAGSGNDLVLPVVRDVDRKSVAALQDEIEALAMRARAGSLKLEQTTGGILTLSNLGMYPVDWFEAIVFPGQSAILAVGAARPCAVVVDGRIEARPVACCTLAADHRLINGRTAAEYLTRIKTIIESGAFAR